MINNKNVQTKIENKTDLIPITEYGDLMNTKEVCEYLRIESDTLYRWVENKIIPHYRITGKKILFNRIRLTEWLSSIEVRR